MLRKEGRLGTEEKAMPVEGLLILQLFPIPLGGQNVSIPEFWSRLLLATMPPPVAQRTGLLLTETERNIFQGLLSASS